MRRTLLVAFLLVAGVAGAKEQRIDVGGETRTYLVAVPDGPPRPRPTVILLHGGGMTPEGFADLTAFPDFARRHDLLAVFPRGVDRRWNDGRTEGRQSSADDVAFLGALVDALVATGAADPPRVYVGGYSNGGMMALRFACLASERVGGIFVVAANQPTAWTCPAQRPLPAIFMHGTHDAIMPWDGGPIRLFWRERGAVESAEATVAGWRAVNGCGAPSRERLPPAGGGDDTTVVIDRYPCPADAGLEHVIVEAGGHTWPGAPSGLLLGWLLGSSTRALDANAELWRFFSPPLSSP